MYYESTSVDSKKEIACWTKMSYFDPNVKLNKQCWQTGISTFIHGAELLLSCRPRFTFLPGETTK